MNYFDAIIPKKDDIIEYEVFPISEGPTRAKVRKLIIYVDMFKSINYLVELDELAPKSIGGFKTINVGHIKRVVEHSKYSPQKINIYNKSSRKHRSHARKLKSFVEHLFDIIDNNSFVIHRSININRAKLLYMKNGFGFNGNTYNFCTINRKKFKKWISMNISKFQNTVSEQREIRRIGRIEEKQYYKEEMESLMDMEDEYCFDDIMMD